VAWGCDGASPHALVAANRVDVLVCERTALDALLEPAQEIPRALAIVAVGDLDGATHLGIALRHGVTVLELFGTHGAGSIATRASPLFRYSPLTGVCVAAAADGRLEVQSPWAASVTLSERVKRATDGTFERVRERAESSVARHGPARWNVDARGESESEFVQLPNDLVFFRGHFDAVPILPGVAQLIAIVLPTARRRFPDLGALRRLRRVRFRRPLLPGETVAVVVHRDEREVRFELRVGAVIATQGTLVFDSAADAS
jgi:hypothetical protein